ncbi:hypothetical protein CWR48_14090, partial [Oceanobacillus arenosus]
MARFPELNTGLTRDFRNSYNEGIKKIDTDLNKSSSDASNALAKSTKAEVNASEAKAAADRTSTELGQAILKGDSSPLAGQLSVGADGTVYPGGPQERLVKELNSVNKDLAQMASLSYVDAILASLGNGAPKEAFFSLP